MLHSIRMSRVLNSTRMLDTDTSRSVYRFGAFELDPRTGELRKRGVRIKLQDQPLHILMLLLESGGELVTREQIQTKLWAPGTYVDYENAINSAVRKLRDALGDEAENPRFIETFARRGYRFTGSIETPHRRDGPTLLAKPTPLARGRPLSPLRERRIGRIVLSGLVFLVIASLGGWWFLRSRLGNNPIQIKAVPLTAAPGWESEPSFSPDGTQMAYVWDEGEGRHLRRHIFVKLIGGGTPLRLTSSVNQDRSPAWSPDGRSIAFVRVSNLAPAIYLIPALGGAARKIAEGYFAKDDLFTRTISWSPDGRFLALAESNTPEAPTFLSLLKVETGEKLRLTTPPDTSTSDINPAFSPDGRKLLFTRCNADCGLYLLNLAKDYRSIGKPAPLKQVGQDIEGAVWTANGRDIVYSLYKADWDASLMRVRAEAGAQPERLAFTGELPFAPFSLAIAPRANRLAYAAILYYVQIWQVAPGKAPRSFASSTRLDFSPEYSPDGKRVAFASNRSGAVEIWACNSDGQNPVQITHFDSGYSGTPRWSPNGRSIAFDRRLKQGWGIFVTASDGSQVRKLTSDDVLETIPGWSADGKWIYYASNRTNRFEIWKAPASGGKGIQVTRNGGYTAFESTDGQSLYYTKQRLPGLWVLPLRGGKEKLLLAADVGREFAVTEDGIYYLPVHLPNAVRSVRFHSFATGKEQEVALLNVDDAESGLTVSPDRKSILFTAGLRDGTNVMIVDNFR